MSQVRQSINDRAQIHTWAYTTLDEVAKELSATLPTTTTASITETPIKLISRNFLVSEKFCMRTKSRYTYCLIILQFPPYSLEMKISFSSTYKTILHGHEVFPLPLSLLPFSFLYIFIPLLFLSLLSLLPLFFLPFAFTFSLQSS